jgi:hypothetical protein
MPVSWEIRGLRLRLTLQGEHTTDELERVATEILASPILRPGMSVIVDVSSSESNASAEEIRDRTARLAPYYTRGAFSGRCAIVTGPDTHRHGTNKALARLGASAGIEIGVFHDMDEALQWLAPKDRADGP